MNRCYYSSQRFDIEARQPIPPYASTLSSSFDSILSQAQLDNRHLLQPALEQHSMQESSNTRSQSLHAMASGIKGLYLCYTELFIACYRLCLPQLFCSFTLVTTVIALSICKSCLVRSASFTVVTSPTRPSRLSPNNRKYAFR